MTEHPEGIEEAETAALELERTIGVPPRVASPAYLDAIGCCRAPARARARRGPGLTVREAMKHGAAVVSELELEVEAGYKGELTLTFGPMEEGFNFPFGGDPEDLMRGLREFAEQQAESVAEAQREQFATLTLNTAVELTAAALSRIEATGGADEQALALRDAMRVLFPEAVALVSAARQGFMRETR